MGAVYDKLLNKPLLHRHDPLVLKDSNDIYWNITVGTDGVLISTQQMVGKPMGLLLALTYAI